MKSSKKLTQNQLIGLVTAIFVVLLGVGLYFAQKPAEPAEVVEFDSMTPPPLVTIDAGYNATLSGEPFYIVEEDDENLYDDGLDTCNEIGTAEYRRSVQNGWFQVVAYEDGMTVEDIIFEQIELREGDKMVAVIYDAEDQEFKAWPNKIIVNTDGSNVSLLDREQELEKGTVVSVSANRDADYCFDYAEVGSHENIEMRWNLVSKPDFDAVDYRAIWEVAFAKGGDSGVDPERFYAYDDPSNSVVPQDLPEDELYWVYGGAATSVTDGGDLPDPNPNPNPTEQGIVVKVDNENTAGQRDVVEGETFQVEENGGELRYSVGLALPADGEVELEFEMYEDGQQVDLTSATELASRSVAAGANAFATGKNFSDGESTLTSFNLEAIDDDLAELPKEVEFRIVDAAGNLDTVSFKVEIIDDELGNVVCTQELRYGVVLEVVGIANNPITDASVIVIQDGVEVERLNGAGVGGVYQLLAEQEGEYTIRVEKAGVESESFDVTLEKDECHVITQQRKVYLEDQVVTEVLEGEDVVGFGPVDSLLVYLEKPDGAENYNQILQDQLTFSSEINDVEYSVYLTDSGRAVLNITSIQYNSNAVSGQINLQVEFAESSAQGAASSVGAYRLKVDQP